MNDRLITTRNLTKIYKTRKNPEVFALKNVNLSIKQGDFISIMGPSGAGKTTLFNLIGLLDIPNNGTIVFRGYDVLEMKPEEKAGFRNKNIGLVFQQFYLIPSLTILENALMPCLLSNTSIKAEQKGKVVELFERFDLAKTMDKYPNEVSGGEQQRAAIIRALTNDPGVILADEPTGNLDSQTAEKVITTFVDLNRNDSRTIIYITHNQGLASCANKTIQLKDGEIIDEQTN